MKPFRDMSEREIEHAYDNDHTHAHSGFWRAIKAEIAAEDAAQTQPETPNLETMSYEELERATAPTGA